MLRTCNSCKSEVEYGTKFCMFCGVELPQISLTDSTRDIVDALRPLSVRMKNGFSQAVTLYSNYRKWTLKKAEESSSFGIEILVAALVGLFVLALNIDVNPVIGWILRIIAVILLIPVLALAIPSALKVHQEYREAKKERQRQLDLQIKRQEEARREAQERKRQEQIAYENWFNSLSPAEQQVELMKRMMVQQERMMAQQASQSQAEMEQNERLAKQKITADVMRTAFTINAINQSNERHHK